MTCYTLFRNYFRKGDSVMKIRKFILGAVEFAAELFFDIILDLIF